MEETPIGGAPGEPVSPGNLREPGLWEAAVRAALGSGHTGKREFLSIFFWIKLFPKQIVRCRKMMREVDETSLRLRECIRMRELAATHRREQMRRLRMLEEQEARKGEAGYDRIEIIAQMDAQRLHACFDSEPFYTKLYNPRGFHTPAEYTLETNVDVERLKMKILLS